MNCICGSQAGAISSLKRYSAISGANFDCHHSGGAIGTEAVESKDDAEHRTGHRPALHRRGLSGPNNSAEPQGEGEKEQK